MKHLKYIINGIKLIHIEQWNEMITLLLLITIIVSTIICIVGLNN